MRCPEKHIEHLKNFVCSGDTEVNSGKQFNVFVREFQSLTKLMSFPEWVQLMGSLGDLVTRYWQQTPQVSGYSDKTGFTPLNILDEGLNRSSCTSAE